MTDAWTFGYGADGQLDIAGQTGGATVDYDFDAVGNDTTRFGTVNDVNQYSDFTYNDRGDLTDDGTNTLEYDPLDRLISIEPNTLTTGSIRLTFGYDDQNRRTSKIVWTRNGSGGWDFTRETKFAYAGGNLVAEFNVTYSGGGGPGTGAETDTLLRTYGWSPGGTLLTITAHSGGSSTTYLPVTDGNGNITSLINASTGAVAATYIYDAFGIPLTQTDNGSGIADANPMRWGGGYFDVETQLYYNLNRYYSPEQGRFLTRDPIAEAGGLNLYAYCQNDPINSKDPQGTKSISEADFAKLPKEQQDAFREIVKIKDQLATKRAAVGSELFTLVLRVLDDKRTTAIPPDEYNMLFNRAVRAAGNDGNLYQFQPRLWELQRQIHDIDHDIALLHKEADKMLTPPEPEGDAWDNVPGPVGDAHQVWDEFKSGHVVDGTVKAIIFLGIARFTAGRGKAFTANNAAKLDIQAYMAAKNPGSVPNVLKTIEKNQLGATVKGDLGVAKFGVLGSSTSNFNIVETSGSKLYGSVPQTGDFSIIDWSGYPSAIPRPNGTFRLLTGTEYTEARAAANRTNALIRQELPLWSNAGLEWHEIQPVKFGGSPTELNNKMPIIRGYHRTEVTPWWNSLQRNLEGK